MYDGLEKRKFKRLEVPLDVTVKVVSGREDLPTLHIKSRNISMGGICLETKSIKVDDIDLMSGRPFARKNLLQIKIGLNPREDPVEAIGEVLWYDISQEIPEFIYQVGVIFREIKNNGKEQLAKFFKMHGI